MKDYTRKELIDICESAVVNVSKWRNRDSPQSQLSVGKAWVLLKANCHFEILRDKNRLCTNNVTIWIRIYYPEFRHFDYEGFNLEDPSTLYDQTVYLPTRERLNNNSGRDWY